MNSADSGTIRKPLIEHIHELQKRLTWCLLAVAIGACVAYGFYDRLLNYIQKPLGQTLYYTSPTGGFSFLLKVCLAVGLVIALPVVIYHSFKFLGPLLYRKRRITIVAYAIWSNLLAISGILFAYFVSLPAALHFLAKFGGENVQSLITVDEYFNFALAYLVGFALLFQLPLLVLFINRIRPLKPRGMMRAQRYIILLSFIVAAFLTPTPDPFNQLLMAAPVIVLYQFSILLILLVNRKRKSSKRKPKLVPQAPPTTLSYSPPRKRVHKPKPVRILDITPPAENRQHTKNNKS